MMTPKVLAADVAASHSARMKPRHAVAALAALAALISCQAQAADWRGLDPQNTLVVDTDKGRIVVELRPDFAPKAVDRVKLLAREGVYDGLLFHRVIENFVDQTGNPDNKGGGSNHPDLGPEFTFRLKTLDGARVAVRSSDEIAGFIGATPFAAAAEHEVARDAAIGRRAWGAYCPGVVGMGRDAEEDSANSEIFFMRAAARRLDRAYTVIGRVVAGQDVVLAVAVGVPPPAPDRMIKVQVAADMPQQTRPRLEVMDVAGPLFAARLEAVRRAKGADFSICDVDVPTRALP